MPKTTVPTAGYDDAGNMTVYELALDESLPPGVHPKPPPGTHPHEREEAQRKSMVEAFLGDYSAAVPTPPGTINIPPPPPGTHPHERELAAAREQLPGPNAAVAEAMKIVGAKPSDFKQYVDEMAPPESFEQYTARVGTNVEGPHPLDIPEPLRRKPGRPPKPRP